MNKYFRIYLVDSILLYLPAIILHLINFDEYEFIYIFDLNRVAIVSEILFVIVTLIFITNIVLSIMKKPFEFDNTLFPRTFLLFYLLVFILAFVLNHFLYFKYVHLVYYYGIVLFNYLLLSVHTLLCYDFKKKDKKLRRKK